MRTNVKPYQIFAITLILLSLALAGCGVGKSPPRVAVTPDSYDFGRISSDPVTTVFTVHNEGGRPLQVESVSTSCGCTTAQISAQSISAGGAADLTVTFDPKAHAGEVGQFMRFVYLRTNDPARPEVELQIRAEVVENPISKEVSQ